MPKKDTDKKKTPTRKTAAKKNTKNQGFSLMEELRTTIRDGETWRFVVGAIAVVLAVFFVIAFASYIVSGRLDQSAIEAGTANFKFNNLGGRLGALAGWFFMERGFGLMAFFLALFLLVFGLKLIGVGKIRLWKWFVNCSLVMIWGSLALSFGQKYLPQSLMDNLTAWGGRHGDFVRDYLIGYIGEIGVGLLLLLTALLFLVYLSRETIQIVRKLFAWHPEKENADEEPAEAAEPADMVPAPVIDLSDEDDQSLDSTEEEVPEVEFLDDYPSPEDDEAEEYVDDTDLAVENIDFEVEKAADDEEAKGDDIANPLEALGPYDPRKDLENYVFPSLSLLDKHDTGDAPIDMDEQRQNKERIVNTMREYGVELTSIRATIGPTVTLYEVTPAMGVRINKIKTLSEDIALRLSAEGVRIIAPIPGKGTVGIEVPNKKPQIVSMESILNSRKFQETQMALPVALGKTITNEVFMVDLAKMPHVLIAGATGQGKSVGLNAVITSLLYKKHPSELKIVMVDPKKVEFSMYEGIEKHYLAKIPSNEDPIITDTSKVVQTLKSLCILMDHRYDLLKKAHCKTIKEYNEKFCHRELNPNHGHEYLPYVVIVIDEFGDLIMTAGKEVELPIQRITQLARAVGMHMVLATQRPTTNIITGTIKANCPARIAFRVSSMIDSRTILDRPGANKLVGKGDMLFLNGMEPVRVQCAFVDTPEVERIVSHIEEQQGYMGAYALPEVLEEGDGGSGGEANPNDLDSMFNDVAEYVVTNQQGSTSLIQRKFSIGYNRAGRIMDQLEAMGIVGPSRGSKAREVLITDLDSLHSRLG
ncbi:MAG: DNA translocase FtsK [Alloprevotella sp.]|nr:DNA translocase FtsK [Alloprevotella sp.]